jgi:acrylyl-CoA reductase (NADPH)
MSFRALLTNKTEQAGVTSEVVTLDDAQLPPGDVVVDIDFAGFNYKDGLCLLGKGGLVRTFPHIAGIDFSGVVRQSQDERYAPGDAVVLTGWRVGEVHWGGFSQRARVKADWLVPLHTKLDTRAAMVLGTAGLTAMLAINRLEGHGLTRGAGDVLVTGAAGGVGSIAVSLLSHLGYAVTALSGRPEHTSMLTALGAKTIINRDEFLAEPDKPLEAARWAGVVDCVGGNILGKVLRQLAYGGSVASLGNAAGIDLNTNVLPFLLRGANILGIDSVMQPYEVRMAAWGRLGDLFDQSQYAGNVEEVGLGVLPEKARQILAGKTHGKLIVNPSL